MGIVRINELARRLGVKNKDIINELDKLGITGKTHSSGVSDDLVVKIEGVFKPIKPETRNIIKVESKKIVTAPPIATPHITNPQIKNSITTSPTVTDTKPAFSPVPKTNENNSINQPRLGNTVKKVILPTKVDSKNQRPSIDKKSHFTSRPDNRPKEFKPVPVQSKDAKPGFPQSKVTKPEESRFKRTKHEQPKGITGLPQKNLQRRTQPKKLQSKRSNSNDTLINIDKIITDPSTLTEFDTNSKASMQRVMDSIRKVDYKKPQFKNIGNKGQRQRINYKNEPISQPLTSTAPRKKNIKLAEGITVREFADSIGQKLPDVIKKFMELGFTPTINQPIDVEASILVADNYGIKIEFAPVEDIELTEMAEDVSLLLPRAPVVTIMGHVDHGKTSLLDTIRKTKVTESEAGGITQHIGAYKINLKGKDIVFLDTPGHEAFTMMRARGAKVTDIVVLVVAADDGVMPQTEEAINHANAANVPIIVAVNKIDKENADVDRVRNELAEKNVISEAWGGKNIFVEVSAKKKIGIDLLLEMILLQAEMIELKANPNKPATGVIIESRLDKGKGPVATVLVQTGTLRVGDIFVAGNEFGRVRALHDDMERKIKEATPSTPVEVIGFTAVPNAGDIFTSVPDEKRARQITIARKLKGFKGITSHSKKLNLDLYAMIKEGEIKELNIIIKADVQGSAEAIKSSVESIKHDKVKVKVIHTSVGGINESDIMLASASNAIIIGFNVRAVAKATTIAEKEGVEIKFYNVIYDVLNDIKKGLEGLLEPTFKEKILGLAEVRQNFFISRLGTIAGCYVTSGVIQRASDGARVIRDSIVIFDGHIETLKRFKDDVKEVHAGYECGLLIQNFNDIKVGDIIENYAIEKIAGKL
ncbi:MAG: translation initiation factor IF-2 [Nitrospirae bacterium]|nr:translation initiation factor IF-2 [Nitrospirota bacterium]